MSDIIFIWLGGPLPEEYLVNISNYSKVFSDFQVELIVNDSSLHLLRKKQLVNADFPYYNILLKRGITVIHYQEVIENIKKIYRGDKQLLENLKKLERIIRIEENGLHNYAAASDIIRGIRLLKGGIYIDLDVALDTKLAQQNIKELEKLLFKYDQQYPKLVLSYFALNEKNMIDSYIINAPKNSEVVKKFLDYVVKNYNMTNNINLYTSNSHTRTISLLDLKRHTNLSERMLFINKLEIKEIEKYFSKFYIINESLLNYIGLDYKSDREDSKYYEVPVGVYNKASITSYTSGPKAWINAFGKVFYEKVNTERAKGNIEYFYDFELNKIETGVYYFDTGWNIFLQSTVPNSGYIIEEKNLNKYGMTHKRDNYWMKDVNVISGINTNKGKFFEC